MKLTMNNKVNIMKLASFIAKTIDKIATPLKDQEKISSKLFEIREVITKKFPVNREYLTYILAHVEALKNT